jgi:hypothetical protein
MNSIVLASLHSTRGDSAALHSIDPLPWFVLTGRKLAYRSHFKCIASPWKHSMSSIGFVEQPLKSFDILT